MENIYLTAKAKKKYMHDFINNVLIYNKAEEWRLDHGLDGILTSINRNSLIQTLYSKKDSFSTVEYLHESYLEFCFAKKVELRIFRDLIPSLSFDFIREAQSLFYYSFNYPRSNPNFREGSEDTGIGCIADRDYFRINTIRLTLESPIKSVHEKFWTAAGHSLSTLVP